MLTFLAVFCGANESPIRFAASYGSHMVLHRAPRQAWVWGYTEMGYIGDRVYLTLNDKDNKTVDLQVATVVTCMFTYLFKCFSFY